MPFRGLTWARIKEHLRKRSYIYLVGFIICLLLTNLLYTSTRPTTPAEQQVLFYLTDASTDPEPLDDLAADALAYGQDYDDTLEEVLFESLSFSDTESDYYSAMLMMTRLAAGDGAVYIASESAAEYLIGSEAFLPLDDYLADGWMEGLDLEYVCATNEDTGETSIAALRLDNVDAFAELGSFNNEGAMLVIAVNGTNIDTSLEVTEYVIKTLMEGNYAPAEDTASED